MSEVSGSIGAVGLGRSPPETPAAGRGCGHPLPGCRLVRVSGMTQPDAVARAPGGARLACAPPCPRTAATRLSVVVVTYNSGAALAAALPPLVAQLGPRDELVVVDNDSGDDTLAVVRELAPGGDA